MVMGGNQMVQMTNGANVASPVRIVTEQTSNQAHQQTQQQQQQQQQQQSQQQGMILTTAGNGTQTVQGQKVVQLIMAQPASGNNRVIGKNGRLPYISLSVSSQATMFGIPYCLVLDASTKLVDYKNCLNVSLWCLYSKCRKTPSFLSWTKKIYFSPTPTNRHSNVWWWHPDDCQWCPQRGRAAICHATSDANSRSKYWTNSNWYKSCRLIVH